MKTIRFLQFVSGFLSFLLGDKISDISSTSHPNQTPTIPQALAVFLIVLRQVGRGKSSKMIVLDYLRSLQLIFFLFNKRISSNVCTTVFACRKSTMRNEYFSFRDLFQGSAGQISEFI